MAAEDQDERIRRWDEQTLICTKQDDVFHCLLKAGYICEQIGDEKFESYYCKTPYKQGLSLELVLSNGPDGWFFKITKVDDQKA